MAPNSALAVTTAEARRWASDPVLIATVALSVVLSAALTALAVMVSAGAMESGSGGVSIETDTVLGLASTDTDVASMLRSSLVLILPIAAIVLGARFAGSEMASGALLTLAVAARRLRLVFSVRALVLVVALSLAALVTTLVVAAAAAAVLSGSEDTTHLSPWTYLGPLTVGAVVQTVAFGALCFAASALTRKWVLVVITSIVYLVAIEPAIQGIFGGDLGWLPRKATSGLVAADPVWVDALPTLAVTAGLAVWAVVVLRRDHAFR